MTPVVQDFLTTFDRLTDSERLDLASEILKRTAYLDFQPLSDEDLVLISEEIFLQLDKEESVYESYQHTDLDTTTPNLQAVDRQHA